MQNTAMSILLAGYGDKSLKNGKLQREPEDLDQM